jgi:hypothetical protein
MISDTRTKVDFDRFSHISDMSSKLGMTVLANYKFCSSGYIHSFIGFRLEDENGNVLFKGSQEEVERHLERLIKLKVFL